MVKGSPVLHKDVAEGAVEDGVDEVGEAQVEDQQVGDGSHPQVALNIGILYCCLFYHFPLF